MSRILLISSNMNKNPLPVYPLGMSIIASSLQSDGHNVKQIDLLVEKNNNAKSVNDAIFEFKPDFIGISIRNIDNVDSLSSDDNWYLFDVKILIKEIKKNSAAPVILGGSAFSIIPEKLLEYSGADYGVIGEGEITFNKLIFDLVDNNKVLKIIQPAEKLIKDNDFFSPLYEQKLADFYYNQSGMLNYQTKRGCSYGCNYCSYPLIEGKKVRPQPPELVVENLERLKKDFNINTLFFSDSIFNDPKEHYLKVAEKIIQNKCNIKCAAYFRPEKISSDKLKLLKRSGLYAMEVGSDAACDATLKGINKSFSFDDIIEFNESCVKQKIPCAHFFMFGGPNETDKTVQQGLKNIKQLNHCVVFVFSGIRILPNTGIQKIAINDNIIDKNNDLLKPAYYVSPEVDKKKNHNSSSKTY